MTIRQKYYDKFFLLEDSASVNQLNPQPTSNTEGASAIMNQLSIAPFCAGGGIAVDLFRSQPMAHVGDTVTYTAYVRNPLVNDNCPVTGITLAIITPDEVQHDFTVGDLAVGATAGPFTVSYTLRSQDQVDDTVVATARAQGLIQEGICNSLATSSAQVCVFVARPAITVTKSATPTITKAGHIVTYEITICNTGNIELNQNSVVDTLLGTISGSFAATLAPGACTTNTFAFTVAPGTQNPLTNTVTATYSDIVGDQHSTVSAQASSSVEIFTPKVVVTKSAPAISKPGDTVEFIFTITNESSPNSPALILDSITDNFLGNLLGFAGSCAILPPGGFCSFTVPFEVTEQTPNPLSNTVTVHYHPEGFTNDITASASASIRIVHPSFTVSKSCMTPGVPGGNATFQVIVTNTGDVTLAFTTDETTGSFTLTPGGSATFTVSVPVPANTGTDCQRSIQNTINVTATLPGTGLPNTITMSATGTCSVITLGRTIGGWANRPGNALIQQLGLLPTTIGSNGLVISVPNLTTSNRILNVAGGGVCNIINCGIISPAINQQSFVVLAAQTLALNYNTRAFPCFASQTIGQMGCTALIPTALPPGVTLTANSTTVDVLAAANLLIGLSLTTATQDMVGQMNALLGCLNRETVTP